MKKKSYIVVLVCTFVALMALVVAAHSAPAAFSGVLAFPFEQLAAALRALALCGWAGNAAALVLGVCIAAVPAALAFLCGGEGGEGGEGEQARMPERAAALASSIMIFAALYLMANPAMLLHVFPQVSAQFLPLVKGILGCATWSFVVLWLVLLCVRAFRTAGTRTLFAYLRVALYVLGAVFAALAALEAGSALMSCIAAAQVPGDAFMAALNFAATALPYVLDILVIFALLDLLRVYGEGGNKVLSEDGSFVTTGATITSAADVLTRRCCWALGLTAAVTAAMNLIQLIFARGISNVGVTANIPVISIVFALIILILARLVQENHRLRADAELIV